MGAANGMDERALDLQKLELVWKGLQYDDRVYSWDGIDKALTKTGSITWTVDQMPPRCQREPRVKSGLGKLIVGRFTDMLFGENRTPSLGVEGDPDSSDWLEAAWKQAELWSVLIQGRDFGGGMGTAVIVIWLKDGEYYAEAINPKWCFPQWEDRGQHILSALEVRYQYPEMVKSADKQGQEKKWYWYRRLITKVDDTVWRGLPVSEKVGIPSDWGTPEKQILHNLGWCPAVWVQNEPVEEQIDGICDFDGQCESIESYDYVLSEQTGGTLANLDPTLILKMKEEVGRRKPVQTGHHTALFVGPEGDAKLLELSGSNSQAGLETGAKLRSSILEACSCVLVDPEKVTGLGQGKDLMESLYRPMLARCGRLRQVYGKAIMRLSHMILDMAKQKHGVIEDGPDGSRIKLVIKLPDRVVEEKTNSGTVYHRFPRKLGTGGEVQLAWPEYFPPTAEDRSKAATTASTLARDVLVSESTRLRFLQQYFPIDDVQAELAAIKAEKDERADRESKTFGMPGGLAKPPKEEADDEQDEDDDEEDGQDEEDAEE